MFLYLSFQAPHSPLQAPQEYIDMYPDIQDEDRRVFSAMMTAMDDAIGTVVTSLKEKGMYDDTLVVFSTGEYDFFFRKLIFQFKNSLL